MDGLFENAIKGGEQPEISETPKPKPKQSLVGGWFKNNKTMLIIVAILVVALVVLSVVSYFKLSSVNTIIACKEEVIDGLNKELVKAKNKLSNVEGQLAALENQIQNTPPPPPPPPPSKKNKKKAENLDTMVLNPESSMAKVEELEELPLNL